MDIFLFQREREKGLFDGERLCEREGRMCGGRLRGVLIMGLMWKLWELFDGATRYDNERENHQKKNNIYIYIEKDEI